MNFTLGEVEDWLIDFTHFLQVQAVDQRADIILFPSFVYLPVVQELLLDNPHVAIGAQNISSFSKGAYTGEVSAAMLQSIHIPYVLLGHSERRQLFHETDSQIAEKIQQALAHGLQVVFCCGEPKEIRDHQQEAQYVARQLKQALSQLPESAYHAVTVAYEPIWAIGTGVNASPEQAQDMHAFIRSEMASIWNAEAAAQLRILYGGSCNASNARALFSQTDVDGGLIGSASLSVKEFQQIITIAYELH
jgi:triosephosphate isomerase